MKRAHFRWAWPLVFLPLAVAAAPPPSNVEPQKFALVIGVTGYPNFLEGERLEFADDDARRFYEFIQTAEGGSFEARNIRLLINEEATRDGILQEIKWVGKRASGDDRVYVFFAGHGVINMLGEAYFMPYDGAPSDPELRGIRADEFLTQIRNWITAKDVVVFVDACHAGAATGARGSSDNLTSALKEKWGTVLTGQSETFMGLFSASEQQRSWEDGDLGHGLFTYYLIEGLRGAADEERDGFVRAGELRRYLLDQVEVRSQEKFGQTQTPIASSGFSPDFVFTIYEPVGPSSEAVQASEQPVVSEEAIVAKEPIISREPETEVDVDSRGRIIREHSTYEQIDIVYTDSTERVAQLLIFSRDPFFLRTSAAFQYDEAENLSMIRIGEGGSSSSVRDFQVSYTEDGRLASLLIADDRQIVFTYCQSENSSLICRSSFIQTSGSTVPLDNQIVRVCPGDTVLDANGRQSARGIASVYSVARDLSRADKDVELYFCNGGLTARPPEIVSMKAEVVGVSVSM